MNICKCQKNAPDYDRDRSIYVKQITNIDKIFFFKQNNTLFISRLYKYMYIKKMTIHNMIHSIINMSSKPKV